MECAIQLDLCRPLRLEPPSTQAVPTPRRMLEMHIVAMSPLGTWIKRSINRALSLSWVVLGSPHHSFLSLRQQICRFLVQMFSVGMKPASAQS
eukprot:5198094-Amphidinium_carterae.1